VKEIAMKLFVEVERVGGTEYEQPFYVGYLGEQPMLEPGREGNEDQWEEFVCSCAVNVPASCFKMCRMLMALARRHLEFDMLLTDAFLLPWSPLPQGVAEAYECAITETDAGEEELRCYVYPVHGPVPVSVSVWKSPLILSDKAQGILDDLCIYDPNEKDLLALLAPFVAAGYRAFRQYGRATS
jgi:hypothetical protein